PARAGAGLALCWVAPAPTPAPPTAARLRFRPRHLPEEAATAGDPNSAAPEPCARVGHARWTPQCCPAPARARLWPGPADDPVPVRLARGRPTRGDSARLAPGRTWPSADRRARRQTYRRSGQRHGSTPVREQGNPPALRLAPTPHSPETACDAAACSVYGHQPGGQRAGAPTAFARPRPAPARSSRWEP